MKSLFGILMVAGAAYAASNAADGPIPWAYAIPPAPAAGAAPAAQPAPDTSVKHLEGSSGAFTRAQISDRYGPADWYPGDHPSMPDVVAHGKKPEVWACGLCHYPNGKGRQENAGVSGLPVEYFIQTMHDFRDGLRKSAEPRKNNSNLMIQFAKNMSDDEIKAAAEYFGAMKWTPWIKVIETNSVPKTRNANGMFLVEGTEKEPLGKRILETPENAEATEVLRDPHSSFFAYVPPGSLKRGEALVTKTSSKTEQCAQCHGEGLKGLGPVPGIAGRSPSYLARQMYDMKQGARNGTWTQLMKPVVANLSDDDILDIVAYTASLKP
jgi:cytochrome c553